MNFTNGLAKDEFLQHMFEEFPTVFDNTFSRTMLENIVNYGTADNFTHTKNDLYYFLKEMIPEVEPGDLIPYIDKSCLTNEVSILVSSSPERKEKIISEVQDTIEDPLQKIKWIDADALGELEKNSPEKAEEINYYLHGNCDEWVLEHFQDGDVAVIWNEFDPGIGKISLIHCYIQRQDVFLDVRGETTDENLIKEGFDYGYIHEKIYCSSLEEYKSWIRNICGYADKKWAKDSMPPKSVRCSDEQTHKKLSINDQIQSASTRAIESQTRPRSTNTKWSGPEI